MKSRLSTVFGKMPKEKIELEKVELGLADDIIKYAQVATDIVGVMKGNAEKVERIFKEENQKNIKLREKIKELDKKTYEAFRKAQKAYSDLGIDMPKRLQAALDKFGSLNSGKYVSNKGNIYAQ